MTTPNGMKENVSKHDLWVGKYAEKIHGTGDEQHNLDTLDSSTITNLMPQENWQTNE